MQQFERRLIRVVIGALARDDRRVGKAQDQQSECSQTARHREPVFPSEMRTRHFGRPALYGLAGGSCDFSFSFSFSSGGSGGYSCFVLCILRAESG